MIARGLFLATFVVVSCAGIGWALTGGSTLGMLAVVGLAGGALLLVVAELGVTALLLWAPLSVVLYPLGVPAVTFDRVWIGAMVVLLAVLPGVVRPSRATRRFAWALAALGAVYGLRALFTPEERLFAVRLWIDILVVPLILFLVVRHAVALRPSLAGRIAGSLTLAGAALGAIGIAEHVIGFDLASLSGSEARFDESIGEVRISGPYEVPETYGLALVLCLGATMYWTQLRGRSAYLLGGSAIALELGAILFTYFRVAWASAIVVIVLAVAFRPRRYGRAVLVVAVSGLMLALVAAQLDQVSAISSRAQDTDNFSSRVGSYKQGIEIWRDHPVFGVGVERYNAEARVRPAEVVNGIRSEPNPHSSFIGVLGELGIVGLAALLWLAYATWRLVRALNRRRREWPDVLLAASLVGGALAYLLFSLTLTMLPYAPSNLFFAVLLGMAAGRVDVIAARERAGRPEGARDQASIAISPPASRAHAGVAR